MDRARFACLILLWLTVIAVYGFEKDGDFATKPHKSVQYEIVERGHLNTLDYSIYLKGLNGYVSGWHDIPLFANRAQDLYNMVVEIPRWTNAKMEMTTRERMAPIRQSAAGDGQPRYVANIFPYHGYLCNYGALPQTWEDVGYVDPDTNTTGDGDPIDVLEIGSRAHRTGAVIQVKVLGVLGLLDGGETDWKLVAIDAGDELAAELNDIADVERRLPGMLQTLREWFRVYKTPTGGALSAFAFDGAFQDAAFARRTVARTHDAWRALIRDRRPPFNTECHVEGAAFPADDAAWRRVVEEETPARGAPAPPQPVAARWHYSETLMAADWQRATAADAADLRAVAARAHERAAVATLLGGLGAIALVLAVGVFALKCRQRRLRRQGQ